MKLVKGILCMKSAKGFLGMGGPFCKTGVKGVKCTTASCSRRLPGAGIAGIPQLLAAQLGVKWHCLSLC